jgi:hypothetical protein
MNKVSIIRNFEGDLLLLRFFIRKLRLLFRFYNRYLDNIKDDLEKKVNVKLYLRADMRDESTTHRLTSDDHRPHRYT